MRLRTVEPHKRFNRGDRVRVSLAGGVVKPWKTRNTGTVVGYSENAITVRVLFDQHKTPSQIHATLLELANTEGAIVVACDDPRSEPAA
jgi:hypothetical protein